MTTRKQPLTILTREEKDQLLEDFQSFGISSEAMERRADAYKYYSETSFTEGQRAEHAALRASAKRLAAWMAKMEDDLLLPVVSEELLELFARIIGNEFYTAGAWVRFARERPRDWAEALRKAQRHRRIAKELRALVRKLEGVRG